MTRVDYPLIIFYDASCPVCRLETDLLRAGDASGLLQLIDMSAPGFDAACWGLEAGALDAAIHGLRRDGSVVRGMEVLRLAYAAAGIGWLLRPTAAPPFRAAFDAAYRLFARHRRAISRVLAPLIGAVRRRRARRVAATAPACACDKTSAVPNGVFDKVSS